MAGETRNADTGPRHPFAVLHVPHASVMIGDDERMAIQLDDDALALELLRITDWYTDELYDLAPSIAAAVVFPVSRLVVDPERFVDDALEPKAACGMGVLYTHTSHGAPMRGPIDPVERERLIASHYRPHHERPTRAVDAALKSWGTCLVLDCHSMTSVALPHEFDQSEDRPDICLGTDAFHTPTALTDAARAMFEEAGFTVAIDRQFAGALVPMTHYQRDARVLALMVEINRGLYMDERTGERLPEFGELTERVQAVLRRIILYSPSSSSSSNSSS